ncbi:MAG: hypothetical protein IJR00_03090, partial [Lachnospiraceae bacterium]|nr:hypothetical protein [Lachnospiraceae bacterium]
MPAVTLFEVIWCRLCGVFREADAYRAIQMFMYALMMPMFNRVREKKAKAAAVFLVLLVPMIFQIYDAFWFYHSIYCDYAVGVLVFYCAFEIWKARKITAYHVFVLSLSLTVMVCAKMTAMACLPMILLLYVMKRLADPERRSYGRKRFVAYLPLVAVPVGVWFAFNRFVDVYVPNTGHRQSYDSLRLSSVLEVFGSAENSSIPYLETVRRTFLRDLFTRNVLLNGSYAVALGFIFVLFLILMQRQKERQSRTAVCLAGVWTLFCGIGYALLMYFLYATAFPEGEAVRLASYERYMDSFLVTVIYLLIAVYYESETWKRHRKGFYVIVLALAADLFFLHINTFSQMLPGNLRHEEETTAPFREPAMRVAEHTEEDARIFYVIRGDNYWHLIHYLYYCSPRPYGGGNIGPAMNENDSTFQHLTIEEFKEAVGQCDYFFCGELVWTFMEAYRDAF